jgi:hypothetical protein
MKPSNISHVIADISYKDSMESLYELKVLVGDKYEDEISKQGKNLKDLDLSLSCNVFYVRSIDELRSLMKITPMYDFIIRSYLVYSFYESPSKDVYISSFGGSKISQSDVKNFLLNTILNTSDKGLLSHLIEVISGYKNDYDVITDAFILSDCVHIHCRKRRIEDDKIIKSVFLEVGESSLPNKDVIAIMRDQNKIPEGMVVREEFIALEPSQIVSFAFQLIGTKEVELV